MLRKLILSVVLFFFTPLSIGAEPAHEHEIEVEPFACVTPIGFSQASILIMNDIALTAWHVIKDCDDRNDNGESLIPDFFVFPSFDLAIAFKDSVSIESYVLPFNCKRQLKLGSDLLFIGYPATDKEGNDNEYGTIEESFGIHILNESVTNLAIDKIESHKYIIMNNQSIAISAEVRSGYSGGLVYSEYGFEGIISSHRNGVVAFVPRKTICEQFEILKAYIGE